MGKYKFARAVAWVLIASSLLLAVVSVVSFIPMLGTPSGTLQLGGVFRSAGIALLVSLLGFAFHALFDVAEAYVRKSN